MEDDDGDDSSFDIHQLTSSAMSSSSVHSSLLPLAASVVTGASFDDKLRIQQELAEAERKLQELKQATFSGLVEEAPSQRSGSPEVDGTILTPLCLLSYSRCCLFLLSTLFYVVVNCVSILLVCPLALFLH